MPAVGFQDVLSCLALKAGGSAAETIGAAEPIGATEPTEYSGGNLPLAYGRVFGGQILAQVISVAASVDPSKEIKSLTMVFPREGDPATEIVYVPQLHSNGRTFATLSVAASQRLAVPLSRATSAASGDQGPADHQIKTVAVALISLHAPDPAGPAHQLDMDPGANPESAVKLDLGMIPWETRAVGGVDLSSRASGPAVLQLWMRTPPLEDKTALHQGLLAYATDLTLIGTSLRPLEGLSQADSGVKFHSAVTSHTIWFHQPFRMDQWLLLDQHSPVLSGSRAFGRGDVYSTTGALVASYAQEAMVKMIQ